MHLDSESLNRGSVYRAWTRGNYNAGVSHTPPGKSKHTMAETAPTHAQAGQLMPTHTIQDANDQTFNVDAEAREEPQSVANDTVSDAELQNVTVKHSSNFVSLEMSSSGSPATRRRRSYKTYPCIGFNSVNSLREQRILEKLQVSIHTQRDYI